MLKQLERAEGLVAEALQDDSDVAAACEALNLSPDIKDLILRKEAELNGDRPSEVLVREVLTAAVALKGDDGAGLAWATIGRLIPPHELRERILRHLAEHGMTSPNELSKALDEGLSQVSYHITVLAGKGKEPKEGIKRNPLVKCVKTEPRRGAVEHYYTLTPVAKGEREPTGLGRPKRRRRRKGDDD